MSEELQMKEMQMKGLQEKITELLKGIEKSKRQELDLADINQKLKEYQIALDGANIELRHIGTHPQKNAFKQMLRDHKQTLKELKNEAEWKNASATKDQLLGDHKGAPGPDLETAEGLMKHGLDTQAQSAASLQRTQRVIEDAKGLGQDTVLKLEQNTAQIEGMYDKLESIESTLERSTKIIKRMARKVATDKYIWVVVFLVFGAIIFIIVWKQTHKGGALDEATTDMPAGTPTCIKRSDGSCS